MTSASAMRAHHHGRKYSVAIVTTVTRPIIVLLFLLRLEKLMALVTGLAW